MCVVAWRLRALVSPTAANDERHVLLRNVAIGFSSSHQLAYYYRHGWFIWQARRKIAFFAKLPLRMYDLAFPCSIHSYVLRVPAWAVGYWLHLENLVTI